MRDLDWGAIRIVLEAVMREELEALIGAWGESSPKRIRVSAMTIQTIGQVAYFLRGGFKSQLSIFLPQFTLPQNHVAPFNRVYKLD